MKTAISMAWDGTKALAAKIVKTTEKVLSLNIDEVGYEYTFTAEPDKDGKLASKAAFDLESGNFVRKEVGVQKSDDQKDEGQKREISGSINFPKNWDSATAK